MKDVSEIYLKSLPLFLLILNSIGFVAITVYYFRFGIDIIFYLTLTDLIFFALRIILAFALGLLIMHFLFEFVKSLIYIFYFPNSNLKKIRIIRFSVLISFIILAMLKFLNINTMILFIWFIFYLISRFLLKKEKLSEDDIIIKNTRVKLAVAVISILFLTFGYASQIAIHMKKNKSLLFTTEISFNYNNEYYSTKNVENIRFIGETSDYIFIYKTENQNTLIIPKSDITENSVTPPKVFKFLDNLFSSK